MASPLVHEKVWIDKSKCEAAEKQYYESLAKVENNSRISLPMVNSVASTHENANSSAAENAAAKPEAGLKNSKSAPKKETVANNVSISPFAINNEKHSKKEKRNKNKERKRDVMSSPISNDVTVLETGGSGASSNNQQSSPIKKVSMKNNKNAGKMVEKSIRTKENDGNASQMLNNNLEKTCNILSEPDDQKCRSFQRSYCLGERHSVHFAKASSSTSKTNSLASEVAKARQHIKESLECVDGVAAMTGTNVNSRIAELEKQNNKLNKIVTDLQKLVLTLENRVKSLEGGKPSATIVAKEEKKDDDDDVDLFGSDDEEDNEAAKVREARLAAYAAKKASKPVIIAKSNIIFGVSPYDDETDMKVLEKNVRTIQMDGLVWGASKLVPVAYGIKKLQISCVVEDDKVSVDALQEKIEEFDEVVQSVDVVAFNKV